MLRAVGFGIDPNWDFGSFPRFFSLFMKILFVAPELPPFSKVGGLGDVVYALSKALMEQGEDVKVFTPKYGGISLDSSWQPHPAALHIHAGDDTCFGRLWEGNHPDSGVPIVFLEYTEYFDREGVYGPPDGGEFHDNAWRYALFSRAAVDMCGHLDWQPDLIHCHDWTTGLIPAMVEKERRAGHALGNAASLITLHNMKHQGAFSHKLADYARVGYEAHCDGPVINFLKNGILLADGITTVSPTYAKEIQESPGGCGMEGILHDREDKLWGVLNGVDVDTWSPETDPALPSNYSHENLAGKLHCKSSLQQEMNLPVRPDVPLFGVVSRLFEQKGLDLLADCMGDFFLKCNSAQIVILGSGDEELEGRFSHYAHTHPANFSVATRFDEALARRIFGGSDFFIMPSRFEPCGLTQMYAMRYGTLPVVRKTGGLADTVFPNENGGGTGVVFEDPSAYALANALEEADSIFHQPDTLQKLRLNGMLTDFSWQHSVKEYQGIYRKLIEARHGVGMH